MKKDDNYLRFFTELLHPIVFNIHLFSQQFFHVNGKLKKIGNYFRI